jgi:hypothetical protein
LKLRPLRPFHRQFAEHAALDQEVSEPFDEDFAAWVGVARLFRIVQNCHKQQGAGGAEIGMATLQYIVMS